MKKALRWMLLFIVTVLLMGNDYSYAQTEEDTDDPGYWKAHGYYQEEAGQIFEDDTDIKYGVRNEGDENLVIKLGMDVSKYQGVIDWQKAKAEGIQFAIIRVGYRGYGQAGNMGEDPYYKANIEGAIAAGVPIGVYMFSQAITVEEAIEEANFILDRIYDYDITLPVVMDYEYTGANGNEGRLYNANLSVEAATSICDAFLKTVKHAGYTPMLYANKYMLSNKLNAAELEDDYYIWLAHYTSQTDYAGTYDFWQFTTQGDGYKYGTGSQILDMNYWYDNGTIEGHVYRIKYELNGGTNHSENPTGYCNNQKVVLKDPSREGYIFQGWYTDKNLTKQIKSIKKGATKDYTLYAKWERDIQPTKVKLNKTSVEIKKGKTYILKATVSPTNVRVPGVTWVSSNEKVATVDSTGKVTAKNYGLATITAIANGNNTIVAKCKVVVPYTIKYVLDEGTNHSDNPDTYYKEEVVLKKPTKSGYVFKGWYTDKTYENKITKIEAGAKKNFTLYAKWQKRVSLKYAEITLAKTTYAYNGNIKKPAVTVIYKGKTLEKDVHYTVSYENNKNIGEGIVKIAGKGSYTGTITKTFKIKVKAGELFTSGAYVYRITDASTVAFAGISSTKTTDVVIPKTVKYGGKTFDVTSVEKEALKKKTKVTSVVVGSNVTMIGASAFEGCTKLENVTLKSGVTVIDSKAFKNCKILKTITIPSKVTKVGKEAFYGCEDLKSIIIKSTKLESLGTDAFKGIYSKATIEVPEKKLDTYKTLLKKRGLGSKVKVIEIK